MTASEIRAKFIEYYKAKDHEVAASAPLVPENDPTTLFTGSGMQPMLSFLLGKPYPSGAKRIVDSQKSFRAVDIEEVGDSQHTTFFEMLGNWSFGDYWKEEQLTWLFEFLTKELNLDPKKLYVSCFEGDEKNGIPKDIESAEIWERIFEKAGVGIEGRIFYYGAKDNWWSRSGVPENMPVGEPGGPDSEVFYQFDVEHNPKFGKECHPTCGCGRHLEIANSVFMEYKKVGEGKFEELPQKNVDFGGGLERMAAATNNNCDMFTIDLFEGVIKTLEAETSKKYKENRAAMQIIVDHLRGATFMIAEGIEPSNKQQGYVLRRLIRRSAVKLHALIGEQNAKLFTKICEDYIDLYGTLYFADEDKEKVQRVLTEEIKKFEKSLNKGLREIEKRDDEIDVKFVFDLHQTYGFPFEITQEILEQKGIEISEEEFNEEREKHSELSKTSAAGAFKGGLGGTSEKEIWYHSLTHLLHRALRDTLGDEVHQAGSNITPDRLRLDFTFGRALTDDEKEKVETIVNDKVSEGLVVSKESMNKQDALNSGALAFFVEKYGDVVDVYSMGNYSKEICGGPHVENTSEIEGTFKIVKEKSVGSGTRRIRAVIE